MRFLFILVASLSINSMAFCSDHAQGLLKQVETLRVKLHSEDVKKSHLVKNFVETQIQFIESYVSNKMAHAEKKLEIYQAELRASEDSEEINELQRKIEKTEKKIQEFHDLIAYIEIVKSELSNNIKPDDQADNELV